MKFYLPTRSLWNPEDTTYYRYVAILTITTLYLDTELEDDDVCTASSNLHEDNNWIACDGCDAWYYFGHLKAIPGVQDQWLCEDCLNCEDS